MASTIEWTDETWNPVTGCTRVSPGCDHCYMFALYPRLKAMGVPGYEGDPREVRLLPERLDAPMRWRRPRRVFVNSMSDVFHPSVPYDFINDIFDVMREAAELRGHVFQVLTKRPGRAVGGGSTTRHATAASGLTAYGSARRWRTRSTRLESPCWRGYRRRCASSRPSRCSERLTCASGSTSAPCIGSLPEERAAPPLGRWSWTGRGTCGINPLRQAWRSS